MLKRLTIANYALIDTTELVLSPGLTVLTGETGSGKSILLGALNLILGERADLSVLRKPDEKCIVEAVFTLGEEHRVFLNANDLDFEAETIVRREISVAGKSRAFINDTPVNLKTLRAFGDRVVDIHSQLETSRLRDKSFRFELLDAIAGQQERVSAWQGAYKNLVNLEQQLAELQEQEYRSKLDLDYFRFQLEELEAARLDDTDFAALEVEADVLRNAEKIGQNLKRVHYELDESEQAILPAVKQISTLAAELSRVHPQSAALHERLKSVYIELQDISTELGALVDSVEHNPERLSEIEALLDGLYQLQTKHRLASAEDLKALRLSLREKVGGIDSIEDRIAELQQRITQLQNDLEAEADEIHLEREKSAVKLEKEMSTRLGVLKMPHARLHVVLTKTDRLHRFGNSDLALLFTANKGSEALPLEKSASGGELSRLMLALKAVIAEYNTLPTLILDEIDTGVSGDVAARMGEVMHAMSKSMQLIAITHLPQVAGRAPNHFKVYKETVADLTRTHIVALSETARVEELAGMLSGETITDSARAHARELLTN